MWGETKFAWVHINFSDLVPGGTNLTRSKLNVTVPQMHVFVYLDVPAAFYGSLSHASIVCQQLHAL